MSILTSASSNSVMRGYYYYRDNYVLSCNQIDQNIYTGEVEGTMDQPYKVTIDLKHPKKSSCSCPHANGNIICKHMVAMYFSIFPEEADDYEEYLTSYNEDDYEEEYDDYSDYYDNYHHSYHKNYFEKPLIFDKLLDNFMNRLSVEKLKIILKEELNKNVEGTFYKYSLNLTNVYLYIKMIV